RYANELAYQVRDIFEQTRVVNDLDVIEIPFKER
ncbi:ribonuclease Z, partial [Limosilactobacillus fermentum]